MKQRLQVEPGTRRKSRWLRLLIVVPFFALTPKCLLCIAAYAGIGTALGTGGSELCGAGDNHAGSWIAALPWFAIAGVVAGLAVHRAQSARR